MRLFQVRMTGARALLLAGLIVLTVVASAAVTMGMPAKYSAKAQAVLIGPSQDLGKPTNPYLQFNQALSVAADVLIVASSNGATVRQIVAKGGTDKYVVERPLGASEPIITVTGEASSPGQAIRTTTLVVSFLTADLSQRQAAAAVPTSNRAKLVAIAKPEQASREWKTPIEIGFGVFVLGVVGSLVAFVMLDRYLVHREVRRVARRRSRRRRFGWRPGGILSARAARRSEDEAQTEVFAPVSSPPRPHARSGNGARERSGNGARESLESGDQSTDSADLARVNGEARMSSQVGPSG